MSPQHLAPHFITSIPCLIREWHLSAYLRDFQLTLHPFINHYFDHITLKKKYGVQQKMKIQSKTQLFKTNKTMPRWRGHILTREI